MTSCLPECARITSRAIVPTGRIFPPFFSAHDRSRTSFAVAFVSVSGNEKGVFLVVAWVRLLVKLPLLPVACLCDQVASSTSSLVHVTSTACFSFKREKQKEAWTCERWPPPFAGGPGRTGCRGRGEMRQCDHNGHAKVQASCEALSSGMRIHITGVAPLDEEIISIQRGRGCVWVTEPPAPTFAGRVCNRR